MVKTKGRGKMVTKLRNGRWSETRATAEEFNSKIAELKSIVSQYGFGDWIIRPYSFNMTVNEFLEGYDDFDKCSFPSRGVMISEVNGFINILNKWL